MATVVENTADELGKLIQDQQRIVNEIRIGQMGRRKAYEELKVIQRKINSIVSRLGSL